MDEATTSATGGALAGDFYDGEVNVCCPTCAGDYSHVVEAFTRLGADENEAGTYEGTQVKEIGTYRRSALVIVFRGECGHRWNLVIQQHKGINILAVEPLPPIEEAPAAAEQERKG